MAVAAETINLREAETAEVANRRTDDIIFNVRYLARHIIDRELGLFDPEAEADVLEQNVSEVAEADIHKLGPVVYQQYSAARGQYMSLRTGTVDNARKGCLALDFEDEASKFEFFRRAEEIIDEESILQPQAQERMRRGAKKITISPSPTHHEADPDVAVSFGYDDRTMLRLQCLSPDGQTKAMQSFSLFNVPAKAWAGYLSDRYDVDIKPTALAVMQFCNQGIFEEATTAEILKELVGGVMRYVDEDDQENIVRQLDSFLHEQAELEEQAGYYATERLALQKELALSFNTWARPQVLHIMNNALSQLNSTDKELLGQRFYGNQLYVDDYVAELATKIKLLTTANRAGLATLNERTVMRMASRIGLEATLELAQRELAIQQMAPEISEFMVRRSERQIAESGVDCGGGCAVDVVGLFSSNAKTALEAGLSGTLYSSPELNKNSKCSCAKKGKKANVISDGKNVVCTTCREFQVKGKRGNLKKAAQHASV